MVESNVAISPDSALTGAHNVRTVTVSVDNSAAVTGGQSEQQQVVTLADASGNLVGDLIHGALPVASEELALLLKAMLVRLDILCSVMDSSYNPPDKLGL